MSSDGKNLSNVKYGANYSGREGVDLEDELAQMEAEGAEAKAFAGTVRSFLKGEPVVILTEDNSSVKLEAGYYIIIDEVLYENKDVVDEVIETLICIFIVIIGLIGFTVVVWDSWHC